MDVRRFSKIKTRAVRVEKIAKTCERLIELFLSNEMTVT